MLIALGLSLSAHFVILTGWGGSGTARTVQTALVPLQARLELVPMPADSPAALARIAPGSPQAAPVAAPAGAMPSAAAGAATDLRFYLARELDRYPAPLSALRLDKGNGPAGGVRLWVSIDHAGRVVGAAVIDADPPGELERVARERVLATRFAPAWRDGRPVKSRVLLVLGEGA